MEFGVASDDVLRCMSPLSLGLPLALPSLAAATRVAAGGLNLLQSLVAPSAKQAPATKAESSLFSLQSSLAEEIRRARFGASLPPDVADDGPGGMKGLSHSPPRSALEH